MLVLEWYDAIVAQGDPRTKGWPLVDSPLYPLVTIAIYFTIVQHIGPKSMMQRQPLQLRNALLLYNASQVLACAWYIYQMGDLPLKENYSCPPLISGNTYRDEMEAYLGWLYMLLKYVDLIDTLFFVLRKKHAQMTFLHLFHHSSMVLFSWAGVKFYPGGILAIAPMLNVWVHLFMYSYYFAMAYNGSVPLYFKKKMTQIQLAQFAIGVVLLFINLVNINCDVPKLLVFLLIVQGTFFLCLFGHFYWTTYGGRKDVLPRYKPI